VRTFTYIRYASYLARQPVWEMREWMSYKILIVDDSKLARMSVIKLLNTLKPDWTRFEAANADEAVKHLTDSQPDVVLLDFNMPGRDGLQLAAELHERNPGMPVAVISANIQVEIVNRAGDAGATFLPKPLTEQALATFLTDAEQRLAAA
jgi:CheY-like chemotaxis protein